MKFKIDLAEYGTVCNRANIIVEADNEAEAIKKAEEMGQEGKVKFDQMASYDSVDGWTYEIFNIEEVKNGNKN